MKKIMLMTIIILLSIITYQGGCFDGCDFRFGAKIVRTLEGKGAQE